MLRALFVVLASSVVRAEGPNGPLPRIGPFTTGGTIQSKGADRQKLMTKTDDPAEVARIFNEY